MIISVKRNFLELKNINELVKKDKPEDNYSVEKTKPDFQINKFFYKQIGKKYRWTDRLIWTDLQWSNYVSNKNLETYVIKNGDDLVGYFELIHHPEKNETELAYLGLFEDYFGKGVGGYALTIAIEKSFEKKIKRMWVHTCTLDHPNAIKNYLARGMKDFKEEKLNNRAS